MKYTAKYFGCLLLLWALSPSANAKTVSEDTTLESDADWTAQGPLVIEAGATLDLAGHTLRVAGLSGEGTLTSSTTAMFKNLTTDPTKAECSAGIASVDSTATAARVFDNTARTIVQKTNKDTNTTYWPFSATYDFEKPTVVNHYKITTGDNNYYDVRAPGQWEVFGSNDKSEWTSLGKAVCTETEWRKTGKQGTAGFELNNYTAYRYYKITITVSANQDAGQGGYIEFWQLQFGYTSQGCAIVSDSVADISGLTVSGDTKLVLSGTISLAKDCDLRSLGTVASIAADAEISLNGHKLYANAAAFTAACMVKDAEISHDDDLTTPEGIVTSPTTFYVSGMTAANLFNNNYARSTSGNDKRIIVETKNLPLSVTYDFGEGNAQIVDTCRLWTGPINEYAHRLPRAWKFEGSNDNGHWTTLDKRGAEAKWGSANTHRTYTFDNTTAYRYYRMTITANNDKKDANGYLELVQLEFFRLAPARGELHVETASGQIVALNQLSLAGNLRFFVEGAGTVYLCMTNLTYVGGTEICGGTVGGGVGLTSLLNMDIFGEKGSEVVIRGDGTKTASAQNAILGFLNRYGYTGYKYVLAGGTIQSAGSDIVLELRLSANSRMTAAENLVSDGYAWFGSTNANMTAYADFGGYICNISVASGRRFALSNATLENGTLLAYPGGWFATMNSVTATNNFSFDVLIAQDIAHDIAVKDYAVKNSNKNFNKGAGVVDVYGTFSSLYGVYHGARLMDGATIDFAEMTKTTLPLPVVCPFADSQTGAKTLLFDTGATIGVKLGARKVAVGSALISWNSATKPDASVKFKCTDTDRRYALEVRDDGLYYMGSGLVVILQ